MSSQIKAGVILNYVIIFLNIAVGLLYTPYMLRTMGQSEYGLYSLVASVISYLTILDLGFGNAIVRYTAKFKTEGKQTEQYEMFGMFLVLYSIIGVVSFVIGLGLYINVEDIFGDTMTAYELGRARIMIMLLIVNLAITFPLSTFGSIIQAYEQFVFNRSLKILRTILSTGVMIALLSMGYRAVAMVIVQTAFNITTLLFDYLYCRYKLRIKIIFHNFKWGFLKEVATYSFWIFLCIIIERVYWSTGQFILGAVVSTSSVAIFSLAITLVQMYMNFSTSISGVFLPRITGMVANNTDNKELLDLLIKTGRIQFYIVSLILSGFIVFGDQFIEFWAGKEYAESYAICVMCFVALFIPLIQTLGPIILQAKNEMKFRTLLFSGFSIVCLFLQIILAPKYGGTGCAAAILVAFFLGQGIILNVYYHIKQKLNMIYFWGEIFKIAIFPTIFTFVSYFIIKLAPANNITTLILYIIVYSIIYLLMCYIMSFNEYEKSIVKSVVKIFTNKYDNR